MTTPSEEIVSSLGVVCYMRRIDFFIFKKLTINESVV